MKLVHAAETRVATLSGHVILFESGIPQDVPGAAVLECLGKGATPYAEPGEPAPLVPKPSTGVVVETDHERLTKLFKEVIARAQKDEFRQDGQPKSAVILKYFGRNATDEERTAAWAAATATVTKID